MPGRVAAGLKIVGFLGRCLRFRTLRLDGRNCVSAFEPASKVDVGTTLGAERAESQSRFTFLDRPLANRTSALWRHRVHAVDNPQT